MKKWILAVVSAVGMASTFAADSDLPTGEQIFDRFVEVTGGKAAYEKRRNEYAKGTVSIPAANITGTLEVWAAAPNSVLMVVDMPGIGRIETGANGTDAWELSAVMGPRLKDGKERDDAFREAMFNLPVHWRKMFSKVETQGVETIEGAACHKVVATTPEGRVETFFFDQKSGLNTVMRRTAVTSMGDIQAEIVMKDYANHGGVLTPTSMIQRAAGQEMHMKFDTMEGNIEMPKSRFDLPAEIKQLKPKAAPPAAKKAA